eukprot:scaffold24564_cov30-Tisochrysis_lutea.AAC.2
MCYVTDPNYQLPLRAALAFCWTQPLCSPFTLSLPSLEASRTEEKWCVTPPHANPTYPILPSGLRYIPPPYSWSALSFPPSRDEGADGRNFADGGGWVCDCLAMSRRATLPRIVHIHVALCHLIPPSQRCVVWLHHQLKKRYSHDYSAHAVAAGALQRNVPIRRGARASAHRAQRQLAGDGPPYRRA